MGRAAPPLEVSAKQRAELERFIRSSTTPQHVALRARMIVLSVDGLKVYEIAEKLGVWRKTVSDWHARWRLTASAATGERLSDAPRSGAPATFTAEQTCAIIALACEPPEKSGLPFSHWTQQALADEAVKRGLVDQISQRSIGRILKRSGPQAASHAVLADAQAGSGIR